MKKLTALCLTFVLAFALSVPAFATSSDTVVNADIINFTPEEIAEQKAIDARLREEFSSAPETRGVVDRVIYNAPIVSHQQINTYYCGPASTQMVYEGITGDTSHIAVWHTKRDFLLFALFFICHCSSTTLSRRNTKTGLICAGICCAALMCLWSAVTRWTRM